MNNLIRKNFLPNSQCFSPHLFFPFWRCIFFGYLTSSDLLISSCRENPSEAFQAGVKWSHTSFKNPPKGIHITHQIDVASPIQRLIVFAWSIIRIKTYGVKRIVCNFIILWWRNLITTEIWNKHFCTFCFTYGSWHYKSLLLLRAY